MTKSIYIKNLTKEVLLKARELKLNSIILSNSIANFDNISKVNSYFSSADVYIDVPVFKGTEELLKKYSDIQAVEVTGKETVNPNYIAICPTHPNLSEEILKRVRPLLQLNLKGLWLSYLHYGTTCHIAQPLIWIY